MKHFASLAFHILILSTIKLLEREGVADRCAIGVQSANSYTAKLEGTDLLSRVVVKVMLEMHGLIEESIDRKFPSEAKYMVMKTKVLASQDP